MSTALIPDYKLNFVDHVEHLEDLLSDPPAYVVDAISQCPGDIMILGVAGKMGPTLARMASRAAKLAGGRRVVGVSRFSNPVERQKLESWGIETIQADLLNRESLAKLPDAPNIIYMAGMKFGSTNQEALTWAMNTYLPGMVCERFKGSRIAAFSTGNIYGLAPVVRGGSREREGLNPVGDYAMSCMGRERMFEHFSMALKIPTSIIRLNYATELRYGVLVDLATKVFNNQPIDLAMGNMNVIWQGDANAMAIASLIQASSPAFVLNVAGPELLSVRTVCEELGELMGKKPEFVGTENADALLNNGQLGHRLYGYPRVPVGVLIRWTAEWVKAGGASLGKPTHFEARDGKF
jgi:uncharacterized protein YbjT (DUF2867 family)